jgi:hypothetical protein
MFKQKFEMPFVEETPMQKLKRSIGEGDLAARNEIDEAYKASEREYEERIAEDARVKAEADSLLGKIKAMFK